MRREESELRAKHGSAFDCYAATVPLFFPSFSVSRQQASPEARFSWSQYKKNHEHQAALGFLLLLVLLEIICPIHTAYPPRPRTCSPLGPPPCPLGVRPYSWCPLPS